MNRTNIEWVVNPGGTQGYTWNPITGCLHSCDYCYARKISMRFWGDFTPKFHPDRLTDPAILKKPSTIFVGSMSDVFGKWVEKDWIERILEVIRNNQRHTFLFLTKNPLRYLRFMFPDNCWLGSTYDNDRRIYQHQLVSTATIKYLSENIFVSFEPLLEDVSELDIKGVDWVIIGALNKNGIPVPESEGGTKREWVKNLVIKARENKIPVFVKDSIYKLWPSYIRQRELPYLNSSKVGIQTYYRYSYRRLAWAKQVPTDTNA